ncbi:MAG: SRPBCC domain-containing protein [Sphingobacteriales bacterium]|nr:MAG: SRPBCC domain-containing protein [Sphingobacteriales bacterium]
MPNIHQAILIASPAESIYQAITQTEGLSAWWTPGSSAKAEVNSIARFPFGDGYYKEMKIVQLVPGLFVKWICSKGDNEWIDTTVSFSLEQGDEQTLLGAHPEIKGQMDQQQNVEPNTLLIFRHDDWKD